MNTANFGALNRSQLFRINHLGFVEVTSPVWADQSGGRIEMPLVAMWRALRPGTGWPPGRVDVRGLTAAAR